jgi:hypothetical protein
MTRVAEAPPPTAIDGEIEREILRPRRRSGLTLDALSQKLAARLLWQRRVGAAAPAERDAAVGIDQADGRRPADLIPRNPLITGLFGLAAGAALALLLPATRRERLLIARAKEDLWRAAEALGHRTAARIRGERATAAAADRSATK